MAHDRSGPDVVMNTRYAGHSEIRSVTDHENNRSEDGFSAIDPLRTHLNRILHGPSNQQEALEKMWEDGVRKPSAQAEKPYVQIVISASPSFFRGDHLARGQWDQAKLDAWLKKTMKWLRKEYGADLAHASLHLDEDTPHIHVLIVPTYERKTRRPSQRTKSGESDQDFADRVAAWESDGAITRTAGRASSSYWSRMWCRRDARKSYYAAVEDLGLGYGRDFVGEDEPSPDHKTTGKWVREQASVIRDQAAELDRQKAEVEKDLDQLDQERAAFSSAISAERSALDQIRADRHSEEETAAKISAKTVAVQLALTALAGEVRTGTIAFLSGGRITVAAPEKIKPAQPEIEPALKAAAELVQVIVDARREVIAERGDMEQAQLELLRDRLQLDHEREEVAGLRDKLRRAIGAVLKWLKRPDLPRDLRADGRTIVDDARPILFPREEPGEEPRPGF